ncbi:MAG: DUF1834 family protein [Bacteroidetes bacterium]|nr:DUF1834 family protein [Bacteroidota bacterium]
MINLSLPEDAIIGAIKTAAPYARTVDTHAGQIDASVFAGADGLITLAPFALIEFSRIEPVVVDNEGAVIRANLEFNVFVGDRSLRSAKEASRGAYGLINDIDAALNGKMLGGYNVGLTGLTIILHQRGIVIYQATYSLFSVLI